MKKTIHSLFLLTCLSISSIALAETETASVAGAAKVNSTCTISANSLSFGTINSSPTGNAMNNSSIVATCTKDTAFTIAFDGGSASSIFSRHMSGQNSLDTLNYNLYKDTTYSQVLGDGQNGSYMIADVGTGLTQEYMMYGALPLNQFTTPDLYSDTISVLLNY